MEFCTYEQGENGEIARYANGFTFEGTFNTNHNPVYGTVRNPDGEIIYTGLIEDGVIDPYIYNNGYHHA